MKVAVTGATGVIGTSAVSALLAAGHDVVGLARTPEKAEQLRSRGATARIGRLSDHDFLVDLFAGADAVANLATRVPVGFAGAFPRAWRTNDRLRTEGVRRVVAAAREAGVRRIVQESVSLLYADQGDTWVHEGSPLDITRATEPASVAEVAGAGLHLRLPRRCGPPLRLHRRRGRDDPMAAARSQAGSLRSGFGRPGGLAAPGPHRRPRACRPRRADGPERRLQRRRRAGARADYVQGYADAVGRPGLSFLSPWMTKVAGIRAEPLTRSLRVSTDHFTASTGWSPRRHVVRRQLARVARGQRVRPMTGQRPAGDTGPTAADRGGAPPSTRTGVRRRPARRHPGRAWARGRRWPGRRRRC